MVTKKVTLKNGTVLEVGKKYTNGKYPFQQLQTVVAIVEDRVWMIDEDGEDDVKSINHNWLPYTEPTPQKEWKTFLIEVEEYNANSVWSPARRAIVQMYSIEYAKRLYPKAKITEVRINIEEVK